jgi:A/G-specific adenine glycosylase
LDAATLHARLLDWYGREKRNLPWRQTRDPYAIWVSEVMLQQTQVKTVLGYWPRFLQRFPTVSALAAAEESDVLALWRGLGYYARARGLWRAAQAVAAWHDGKLPAEKDALLALPGFGRYTAGAVGSIAFGLPLPLVDGNVARVFSRLFAIEGPTGEREREKRIWAVAEALLPPGRPGDWNQALMELGATVCTPKTPRCERCPLMNACTARAMGRVHELPEPKVRAPRKALHLACAVVERKGRVLLLQRPSGGLFGGLWELPSIEVPEGAPVKKASAGLKKLLGAGMGKPVLAGVVQRTLTHRDLTLRLFRVPLRGKVTPTPPYQALLWADGSVRKSVGMSTAMRKALEAVNIR